MKHYCLTPSAIMCVLAGVVLFSPAAVYAENIHLEKARQALEDGLPQVAIYQIKQGGETTSEATLLLARALFAAGRYAESKAVLEKESSPDAESRFWLAESLSALGQWKEALDLYSSLSGDKEAAGRAVIGQARMLQNLGRSQEAIALLETHLKAEPAAAEVLLQLAAMKVDAGDFQGTLQLLDSLTQPSAEEQPRRLYLAARAQLALGQPLEAEKKLHAISDPPADLAAGVAIAQAECQLRENDMGEAEKILEEFIEENPRLPALGDVFSELDRVYATQTSVSGAELRRWSNDAAQEARAALALYYLARNEARAERTDVSRELYAKFLATFPHHPLAAVARTDLAILLLGANHCEEALKTLEGGQGDRVSFLRGQALACVGKYKEASENFLQVPDASSLADNALFDAAICGLLAGFPDKQNAALQKLQSRKDAGKVLEKFQLIEALQMAAQRDSQAGELLRRIADSNSLYAEQARLALAEWQNLQLDLPAARAALRRISSNDAATNERADYLAVFLADGGDSESENQVSDLAQAFLKAHPRSSFEPEVRMKLGEMLFRRGDYLGAQAQFSQVEDKFPDSPLAEKAAFFSAQAMERSMESDAKEKALAIYEEVAKAGGPLALRARFAQAVLFNALKRPKEALGVLDSILDAKPDIDLRNTALMEKGVTLFWQGEQDAANYREAIAVWKQIADEPQASRMWRNQALYRMGAANEKLGQPDAALDCYYSVFSSSPDGKPLPVGSAASPQAEPEYFWYYKAGFDAGRLLESQKQWQEAIAVYEKISSVDGPRAQEARDAASKLRLANFIWEN